MLPTISLLLQLSGPETTTAPPAPTAQATATTVTEPPASKVTFLPDAEAFATFRATYTHHPSDGSPWFARFELPRVRVGLTVGTLKGSEELTDPTDVSRPPASSGVGGRLLVEGVRSTADGGLLGAAGDSVLLRMREAYGAWRPIKALEFRAGMIPLPLVDQLDGGYDLRVTGPSGVEAAGLIDAADLGASCSYWFPKGYGRAFVAGTDGEGYTRREQNRAKNVEAAVVVAPDPRGPLRGLTVGTYLRKGTRGALDVRADRATLGAFYQRGVARAGLAATYARGIDIDGTATGYSLEAYLRLVAAERWIFGLRGQLTEFDTRQTAQTLLTQASFGMRIESHSEVHAIGELATSSASYFAQNPTSRNLSATVAARFHY
jgi:hypothetical protein